jgi:hypothetical protein
MMMTIGMTMVMMIGMAMTIRANMTSSCNRGHGYGEETSHDKP